MKATPVRLPPGRARLETRPVRSGNAVRLKTIGMVVVACFAARLAGVPAVQMTSTLSSTSARASRSSRGVTLCPARLDSDVPPFDVTELRKALSERFEFGGTCRRRSVREPADTPHLLCRLRLGGEWRKKDTDCENYRGHDPPHDTSVGMAGGESSRTLRRAPARRRERADGASRTNPDQRFGLSTGPARTVIQDAVALHASVKLATAAALLEERMECVEGGHAAFVEHALTDVMRTARPRSSPRSSRVPRHTNGG